MAAPDEPKVPISLYCKVDPAIVGLVIKRARDYRQRCGTPESPEALAELFDSDDEALRGATRWLAIAATGLAFALSDAAGDSLKATLEFN